MSRGIRLLAPVVIAAVVLALTTSPAVADPGHDVPDDADIVIMGDGSGHGIGMSQYGAYGAARAPYSMSSRQILRFYYPGTGLGTARGQVKVWISADRDRDLRVDDRQGLTIRRVGGRTWRPRVPRASKWRVTPARGGVHVIRYRARTWRTWKRVRGTVELSAGGRPLRLRTPSGAVRYRGALRSTRLRSGQRITVNVLPLEQYLRGVVPSEMPAGWPQRALRAQAVAARTYAVHERGDGNTYYDVCDTAACQAYGGARSEEPATTRAVTATSGDVLTFGGQTALAMYSASNGGYTVDGGEPYLPAQDDPHEGDSDDYYGWRRTFTTRQFEKAFGLGNLTYLRVETRDGRGPRGGRVTEVRMRTEGGFDEPVDGEKVRRNLGLPSSLFEVTRVR
ncbi:SpoIID/LytB domain-containing protein [Nocardioides sp. GXQ0305]|uniref:SpoIID/LytB domain-containing protein n=1 Tax=Nocardioides sp. GXQ0305 TaxID=3423912 RepID=UPI003D7DAF10